MYGFLSSTRSTMLLRRHKLPIGFTQNLFGSTLEKSFSTTSIQNAYDNRSNKKPGILSKLKNIFNKSDNISHEVYNKAVNRQSILARSIYLKNRLSNCQINHSLSSKKKNNINEEFNNATRQTVNKNEENMVLTMNKSWNNKFYNFYNPKEYDYCINDSLFNFDPCNRIPTRTESLIGCDTFLGNVNNHVEVRNKISFVPQTSRPPIREPNMTEKQEKKDEKKKKKKKKPVVRAHDYSVRKTEHFFRINIGQSTQYVSNLAMTRNPVNYNLNMSINKRYVSSGMNVLLFKEITESNLSNNSNKTIQNVLKPEIPSGNSMLSFDKNYPKPDNKVDDSNMIKAEKAKNDTDAIEEPEFNLDTEISAWRTLVDKSKPPPEKRVEQELVELQLDKVSIRPEPPMPKLDIEMVKPLNNQIRNEEELEDSVSSDRKSMKSTENIRAGSMIETQKFDNRKYHTMLSNKVMNKKDDVLEKILIIKKFSKSRSPSNMDSESTQRSNTQNQQVSKTKVQSDQNAFVRSSARESENTDEGTSNESKRSSLSTDFQSGISKHEEETTANFTQTFDAVDGERMISLNHSNQGDSRLPLSVTISSRPKQEQSNVEKLDDEAMNIQNYANDEYPYTCFNESYFEETKYADSKQELNKIDDQEQEMIKESNSKELEEENDNKMEVEVHGNDEFVRIPGDPYPYSREHFNKWRLPRKKTFEDTILKTLQNDQNRKRISDDVGAQNSKILGSSSIQNLDDSKTSSTQKEKHPIREMSHDSHSHDKFYHAMLRNNIEHGNRSKKVKKIYQPRKLKERKFSMSSLDQKIIPECLRRGVDDVSHREFHRWIHSGFRTRYSQNQEESEEKFEISKNKKTDLQSLDPNKKKDQFVKVKNVFDTLQKGTPVSEKTNHHDNQPQSVFNKTKIKEDVAKYKVSNLEQEHQFRTVTSVKKEKELRTVTRLETEPSMTIEEFKKIYEMKNYSYLRTEEIKDTRPIKVKEP